MSQPVSMNSIFEQAIQSQKALAEDVENKKNFVPTDYEEIEYCALEVDKEKVIRPVGDPFNPQTLTSPKDTDIKIFMHSEIVKDNGENYCKINWPAKVKTSKKGVRIVPDPDYILTKLYNTVMKNELVDYTEKDINPAEKIRLCDDGKIKDAKDYTGHYIYVHKETEIYKRITANGKHGKMKSFYPSVAIYMNVRDNNDSWCEENKHTKLLLTNLGVGKPYKNEATGAMITPSYPSKGITKTLYDAMFERAVKSCGGWNKDLIIKKKSKKTGEKTDVTYDVWEASDLRVHTGDISAEAFALAKEGDVPADWEKYDLKKLSNPSPAFKLHKNLEGLFKLCDATFGTKFFDELLMIEKIEQEEYNKAHPKEATDATTSLEAQKNAQTEAIKEETKTVAPAPVTEAPKRERTAPAQTTTTEKSIADLCAENFPKWSNVSAVDKEIMIKHISKFDNTTPLWKQEVDGKPADISPCSEPTCFYKGTTVQTNFPFEMKTCPVCGAVYG